MKKKIAVVFVFLASILCGVYYLWQRNKKIKATAVRLQRARAAAERRRSFHYDIKIADSADKGYILTAPYDGPPHFWHGYLTITDMSGHIIVQKEIDRAVYDFRQWRIGNKVYYSYLTDDTEAFHNKGIHLADGHAVILDASLQPIREVHLVSHDDVNRDKKNDLDVHDFIMLGENHFITAINYAKHVTNIPSSLLPGPNVMVGACIIQELVDGKVVWQWDATHYPEFYLNSIDRNHFGDTLTQDYCHFNSLFLDPTDSNLIVSFRGLNQVIKVSRKTGAILWRLGGKGSDFPLTKDQEFLAAHAMVFTEEHTLLMFDNGDEKKRPYSRVLEFRLDERKKSVTHFSAFRIPGLFSAIQGNVSKVGGNYLIGGGSAKCVLLVDPKTDKVLLDFRGTLPSYRAYKIDSLCGLENKAVR